MGMREGELQLSESAVDAVVECYRDLPGVRDLEQAAEHLAANALFQIETRGVDSVRFDAEGVRTLLGL